MSGISTVGHATSQEIGTAVERREARSLSVGDFDKMVRNVAKKNAAEDQLVELERQILTGQMSIGAALARAVLIGARLESELK